MRKGTFSFKLQREGGGDVSLVNPLFLNFVFFSYISVARRQVRVGCFFGGILFREGVHYVQVIFF